MKVTQEHLNHMRAAIGAVTNADLLYPTYKKAGLSDERYRWDIARMAGLIPFMCDTLYLYCDDAHIDTALRLLTNTK